MSISTRTLTNSRHRSTTARKRSRVSIRWRRTIGSGAPRRNLPLRASNPPPRQPESTRYS